MLRKLMRKAKGKRSEDKNASQPSTSTQYTGASAPPPVTSSTGTSTGSRPNVKVNAAAESYDEVPETELSVSTNITIVRRYRDRDEWGNEDDDYWTADVRVLDWFDGGGGYGKEMKVRFQEGFEGSSGVNMVVGGHFAVEGVMFLDPGKQWTSTFVLIRMATRLGDEEVGILQQRGAGSGGGKEKGGFKFELEARVQALQEGYCVVSWMVEDDYENTEYGQVAKICFAKSVGANIRAGILHRTCFIRGELMSADPDENTWACTDVEVVG